MKNILDIQIFDGDDNIKYIKYDDLVSCLDVEKEIIKELRQENERLKEENEDLQNRFNSLMEAHKICDEENERLNNIINEIEKDCNELIIYKAIATKIKELKGSDR